MDFITTDGATLHSRFSPKSSSKCILLINGYSRPMSDFNALVRYLNDHNISTLAFDNRGSGKTSIDRPFSDQDMAQDIFTLVNHYDIRDFFLLGISMGGVIAQRAYAKDSRNIKGLILVSTTCDDSYMNTFSFRQDYETNLSILKNYFASSFYTSNLPLIQAMAKQITNHSTAVIHDQKKAFHNFNTFSILPTIKCPTLVLHGSEDRIMDARVAQVLADEIENSKLKIYEQVGHLILAENPKVFYSDVLQFIESNS